MSVLKKETDNTASSHKSIVFVVIIVQQITDPPSRQRGRHKIINPQLSEGNFKEKQKLVAGCRWAPDTKIDWLTDCQL
jgi:hypothetical protein